MLNYRQILREAENGENGGAGNEPEYNLPPNVQAALGRFGIEDPNAVDPDKFFDQITASEYGQKYLQSKMPKPEADPSAFMNIFAEKFDLEGVNSPEELAEMFYNLLPDDEEEAPQKGNQNELLDRLRDLELERDRYAEETGTFEQRLAEAQKAAKFEAITEYKISENILQNAALTETGRANVELVKSGVMQYLKSQGIELRPTETGSIELAKSDGMPLYVQGSKDRQTLGNVVNEYLSKNKWLSESPASGSGNLSQRVTSNQNQQTGPRKPTAMLWTGAN